MGGRSGRRGAVFDFGHPEQQQLVQRSGMALATLECTRLDVTAATGGPLTGHGTVEVTDHGRVWIDITLPASVPPFDQSGLSGELRLEGETKDGRSVTATRAYVQGTDWHSARQEAVIRLASLDPVRLEQKGGASTWSTKKLHLRNITALWPQQWSHAGFTFDLHAMDRGRRLPERDRAGLVDFELTVKRSAQAADDWTSVRSAVLKLLSLAARSPCSATMEETWDGTVLAEVQAQTGDFDFHATHLLVPLDSLGSYMALALPEYLANEADAGLDTLVAYYCRSHTESMAEYKFLFAGVLMEALKFNWAVNRRKLSATRTASGLIKEFPKPNGKGKYSFKELLDMVASDLGVSANYTFIENRNAVFHTGQAAAAQTGGGGSVWPVLKPELVKLHDEVDDLLLSLLKYAGPITSYWNMGQRLQFPGRAQLP